MATANRVFWETVTTIAFVALLVLVWIASGQRAGRRLTEANANHQRVLAEQAALHTQELEEIRSLRRREAEAQVRAEAEAAFRGYVSGIQPAVAARWRRFLNTTRDQLLAQPRVTFVHLMTPEGLILMSTKQEFLTRGRVDESGDWARAATELVTRPGSEQRTLELAGPILDGGRPVAYLWMGYELGVAPGVDSTGEATDPEVDDQETGP